MGKRKKHHYIPQFYLKRFSIDEERKCVALYNHKNKLFVQSAQIRHQACEEFLYGTDDDVENDLSKLENAMASMFQLWTEEKILVPPPQNTNAFTLLKRFVLYQIFRTLKEGNNISELITQSFTAFLQVYHPEKINDFKDHKLGHQSPVLLNLLLSSSKEYLLNFLDCRFIVNLSELPFITSDAPVVRYNQLMEDIGFYTGATGLPVKGLQIFFPIHPRLMICLYDPKVYSCGVNSINCVSTESANDVHQLDALQYLNSNSQLFFDDNVNKEYIEYIIEQFEYARDYLGTVSSLTKTENKTFNFFASYEDARIKLDLTFFKTFEKAKEFPLEIAPLRHPSLARKKNTNKNTK